MDPSQLSVVLALSVATTAGTGDYLAAHAARRIPAIIVAAWVQAIGLVVVVVAGAWIGWPHLATTDIVVSALGGLSIAIGIAGLYGALAIGPMGVTAPVAAVVGAAVPVVVSLGMGHALAAMQYLGLVLGLVAVTLLAGGPSDSAAGDLKRGVGYALLGGLGIGAFTLCLDAATPASALWPLPISRAVAAAILGLAAMRLPRAGSLRSLPWPWLAAAGVLDSAAMVAFLLALRTGHLAIVAVLSALYPAVTVALATIVDRERLLRAQLAGMVAAASAIVLIIWPV